MSRVVVTADEFLTSPALERPKEDVPVPELGEGKVIPVWGMTPRERTEWEDSISRSSKTLQAKKKQEIRERWLVECCRDDAGVKLFTLSQVEQIGQRSSVVVERLVNAALRLSGATSEDIEKLVKNSDAAPEG
jgi:hypothetical protein